MRNRIISAFLSLCMLVGLCVSVKAESGNPDEPPVVQNGVTVWDMESLPDSFPDWLIDRYVEMGWRNPGEIASGAGFVTLSGATGKGFGGSRALGWTQNKNEWGNATWVCLGNDRTAKTDWSGAAELYFYIDASELSEALKGELLLYTAANQALRMQPDSTWYYWQNGAWAQSAVSEWNEMQLPAGYSGWLRLPLESVYGSCYLSSVERIGFSFVFSQENATVYLDQFMLDRTSGTEPSEPPILQSGVTVWDMESLPDSFPDWLIDRYVEMGWRNPGEIASGAGFVTLSGATGKGFGGSRALGWTQNKNEWGNATWVCLGNDRTAKTDWSGAAELYFYIDASELSEALKGELLLYTAANQALRMQPDSTWYYWQNGAWAQSAVSEWNEMQLPVGYRGWVRIPITQVYGSCELRNIQRIGFSMVFSSEHVSVYIDHFMLDACTASSSFNRAALEAAKTEVNLVPTAPLADSADYFCTWGTQSIVCGNGKTVRDVLTDEALFGANGWAYFFDAETRRDLTIVLDDGWDLPYSDNGTDNADYYGSFILDETKFPNYGETYPQRLKTLVDKFKAAGWKGVGVWVCCQEDAVHRAGSTWDAAYWAERILWCREAGISYWKIDWGDYCGSTEWRRLISDLAERLYPELVIEHIVPMRGTNDAFGLGDITSLLNQMAEISSFSDVFRTYDVTTQLSMATTFERNARLLAASRNLKGDQLGLINCEDELYLAAALGLSGGIMRSEVNRIAPTDEAARMVRWHRIAPSYDANAYPAAVSDTVLTDTWHFNNDTWDSSINQSTVQQHAPAAVSRGIDLPTANGQEVPFLAASRNPLSGAISVGSFRRTSQESQNHLVYSDVSLNVGALTGKIGVFGVYESLTLTFDTELTGKRILAQDLLGCAAYDITDFVEVNGSTLKIAGDLLQYLGT